MATTFSVTTTADSGAGSLRQALTDASGVSGAVVAFNSGLNGQTIVSASALPDLANATSFSLSNGVAVTMDGDIGGAFKLTKINAGTLTLSGANSYGQTQINAGVLSVQSDANLGADLVTINASGTLQVTGATTIDNVIAGTGTLIKSGSGLLTLSATSTFSGAATVSAGTLAVTGTIASATTVASGATLGGTGTISGAVVVNGVLAPGASPGVIHTGNLTIAAGGELQIELGGATAGQYDQVVVTGAVTLGGALNTSLVNAFIPYSGAFTLIDNDGVDAVSGTFSGLTEGASLTVGAVTFSLSYAGGDGNDVVLTYMSGPAPASEPDTPTGGDDHLSLPAAGGALSAGGGNDVVTGSGAPDWVNGNSGDDQLFGGDGGDTLLGGQGADVLQGNTGDDILFGDLGDDSVMGGKGDDVIQGGAGNDIVLGDLGADTVLGGKGDDVVAGGDGDDVLSGDQGDDLLIGGAGADIFNFVGGSGRDVVADFSHAEGDHIRLSAADAPDFAALLAKMSQVGADTQIDLGGEVVILTGVSMTSLTAGDFLLG